LKTLRKYHW